MSSKYKIPLPNSNFFKSSQQKIPQNHRTLEEVNAPIYIRRNARGSYKPQVTTKKVQRKIGNELQHGVRTYSASNPPVEGGEVLQRQFHRFGGEFQDNYNTSAYSNQNNNYSFFSRDFKMYNQKTEPLNKPNYFKEFPKRNSTSKRRPYEQYDHSYTNKNTHTHQHPPYPSYGSNTYSKKSKNFNNTFSRNQDNTFKFYNKSDKIEEEKLRAARYRPNRKYVNSKFEEGSFRQNPQKGQNPEKAAFPKERVLRGRLLGNIPNNRFRLKKGDCSNYCPCGMDIKRRELTFDNGKGNKNNEGKEGDLEDHQGLEKSDNYGFIEINDLGKIHKYQKVYQYS